MKEYKARALKLIENADMVTHKGSDDEEEEGPWADLDPLPVRERDTEPWRKKGASAVGSSQDDWAAAGLDYESTEVEPEVVVADAAEEEPEVVTTLNANTAVPSMIEVPCPRCKAEVKGLIDQCTSCGYRFNAAVNAPPDVQTAGDEIQEALKPVIITTFRGGRGPDAIRRRDSKKALQSAMKKGYTSLTDRYDKDEKYRENMADQKKDRHDVQLMDEWAVASPQDHTFRTKEEIYDGAQYVWKNHRGHVVDTTKAQIEANAMKTANAPRRYDRHVRTERQDWKVHHGRWAQQGSEGQSKGESEDHSRGSSRSARDKESWSKDWW